MSFMCDCLHPLPHLWGRLRPLASAPGRHICSGCQLRSRLCTTKLFDLNASGGRPCGLKMLADDWGALLAGKLNCLEQCAQAMEKTQPKTCYNNAVPHTAPWMITKPITPTGGGLPARLSLNSNDTTGHTITSAILLHIIFRAEK